MKTIKDLSEIEKQSLSMENRNWDFLSFLRNIGESAELNKLFISIMSQLEGVIDCTQCGNCCRHNIPVLDKKDIERVSACLQLSNDEFTAEYLHKFTERDLYIMNRIPCPFLKDNVCSVYEERFESCRIYPQLLSYSNVASTGNLIRNTAICPIIFNFYEILKEKLKFRDT
ncbi:MAG: YkgJ family cysteine cluster protein [candidate division WOR-3 bacterium]|nr:YkgJ family cysteine cluster protein [candidate division WOR-3 bacterium]